jgi:deoxyadenosine/deoxycytidine kinase
MQIRESGKKIIQDRTIYEDAHILLLIFCIMGLMTNRDFQNYFTFGIDESTVKTLIYLFKKLYS